MDSATFVGRERELTFLRDRFERDQADLIVLYGRRRVGKSALVREAARSTNRETVIYQATETTAPIQREEFKDAIERSLPQAEPLQPDWEPLLTFLGEQGAVVIVDEFPYLVQTDPSIPSRFQRAWDETLQHTNLTLVLVGSSISVMEDEVLSGSSPLHGRRTATLDLTPLPFGTLQRFFPAPTPEDKVLAWSLFGGTPHALRTLDPKKTLQENVQNVLLDELGLLHDEPELLLRSELERPNTYFAMLAAMARGRTQRNEIAQAASLESANIGSYLKRLQRLRIVHREVPATEDPSQSRQGRYRIHDPLFRAWFRFVHGQQEHLARLGDDAYETHVEPHLSHHASPVFEDLCHEALPHLQETTYQRIGRWWHRGEEIDLVALAPDDPPLVGECKFTSTPLDRRALYDLEETAQHVRWPGPAGPDPHYALFSRSGFKESLRQHASERADVHLYTLDDTVRALEETA